MMVTRPDEIRNRRLAALQDATLGLSGSDLLNLLQHAPAAGLDQMLNLLDDQFAQLLRDLTEALPQGRPQVFA